MENLENVYLLRIWEERVLAIMVTSKSRILNER